VFLIHGRFVAKAQHCPAERKHFFFEKKKQKTFVYGSRACRTPPAQINRSFLLLFFKKAGLAYAACAIA
jgi:hypothetical protein